MKDGNVLVLSKETVFPKNRSLAFLNLKKEEN